MKLQTITPTPAALLELGRRLAGLRRQRGLSQVELAARAGVGVATLRRIEDGRDAKLGSWVRLVQVLDLAGRLDLLVPEDVRSPLAEVRDDVGRKRRARPKNAGFVWGDERE